MDKRSAGSPKARPTELAHRLCDDRGVTLLWTRATEGHGDDRVVVRVCDRRQGAYFEIQARTLGLPRTTTAASLEKLAASLA